MATRLITLRPEQPIHDAINLLLKHGISGAPVVDDTKQLIGILSELDCLRMLSSDEFLGDDQEEDGLVEHFMSKDPQTIEPEYGVYRVAHVFITTPIRRLPVVADGSLIGQVSRRDVLRAIQTMHKKRLVRRRYPDYREPA
jgi:CBS domain-containing protein